MTFPHLRLPDAKLLFHRRAERFAALAPGHTLQECLELLAEVAVAQRAAIETVQPSLPGTLAPQRPLDAVAFRRGPEWLTALTVILDELSAVEVPDEARAALDLLAAMPPPELEALADRVLANVVAGADLAAAVYVAAALQVYFTGLAAKLSPAAAPRTRDGCPVCGSLPVVALVLGELRYLVCSLCGAQWHTGVQCIACHEGKGLTYHELTPEQATAGHLPAGYVKGEACPTCKAYAKVFYVEAAPALEPFADDVATLALDLLLAENGWARHGVNLFLMPGEERLTHAP